MATDLLQRVVSELRSRRGRLSIVARESGVSYDTVLRIKNGEGDPGYSSVRCLGSYLFGAAPEGRPLLDVGGPVAAGAEEGSDAE